MPTCWIIAGPNGAGKTTFALEYLPRVAGCTYFINADLIAAGLSPFAPERKLIAASRIFLQEIENCIERRENFAFETTLAGRSCLQCSSSAAKIEISCMKIIINACSRMPYYEYSSKN